MDRGEDPPFSHREIVTDKCCWLDENIVDGKTETDAERETKKKKNSIPFSGRGGHFPPHTIHLKSYMLNSCRWLDSSEARLYTLTPLKSVTY